MSNKYVLEVSGLQKSYDHHTVVRNLHFSVEKGDVYGFLGPNGAGKTTTIRMILGLIHKDEGTVVINGHDMDQDFKAAINPIGAVVETPKFHQNMTAEQNLKMIANLHPHISKGKINDVLETVGLSESKRKKVKAYSLGMKQRLGIAMALLNDPQLVFLDEPTNGIDPQGVIEIRKLISSLAKDNDITFFITTHLLHEVEQICNKVAILRKGELITEGYVHELLNTDIDQVEIRSTSIEKIMKHLNTISYVKTMEHTSNGIIVSLEKGKSGELNRWLNDEGFIIDYVIPKHKSLEEIFIDLTEGASDDANQSNQK